MNILLNVEKGIEVAAEDLFGWLNKAQQEIKLVPQQVAALGVVLTAVQKVVADVEADVANPINITLLPTQVADLKAVWPAIEQFASTLGIKL